MLFRSLMAEGKTGLQSVAVNNAARAKFEKAFYSYDKTLLAKIGKVWSNDYNINKVDGNTNPLLLVSNGAYLVQGAVPNSSVTLTLNRKYNSGPKTSGIKMRGTGAATKGVMSRGPMA